MTKDEFKQNQYVSRRFLLKRIENEFIDLGALAIHQFGSGTKGFKDEFSDIDILIVFEDKKLAKLLPKLNSTFKRIAPILVIHHSKSWSPVGGSANSVLHETEDGLFIVDYYISKSSETGKINLDNLKDNFLEKGIIKLNRHIYKDMHDSHTLKNDIDLLLNLIFISSKEIVRNDKDSDFVNTIKSVHTDFRKRYPDKLKQRQINLSFKSNYRLLTDLNRISNKRQKRAIYKIRKYMKQAEELHQN
jgi:predicted nucleotidyltransferase